MVHCGTRTARLQMPGRIYKQAVTTVRRNGRRVPAAALPSATGQVGDPRLGRAGGARAGDHFATRERMLNQRRNHRRLCRQLNHVHPAVVMTEDLACLGNANQAT
jgi:hypothetical protein